MAATRVSSISNSEVKRFLTKTLAFLLPVIVFVVLCEIGLRSRMTDYKYKNQWLTEHASTVEVFVLGSSHTYSGIDPTVFSLKAFNGAHMSQDLNYDEFILRKFAPGMDSLRYLILPISYFTPYWKLEETPDHGRVKDYMLYYHCPYHRFDLSYRLEVYDGLRPLVAMKALVGIDPPRFFSDLGQLTNYARQLRNKNWKESGKAAAERHTDLSLDQQRYDANLAHAKRIAAVCQEKGVTLILLTTPTYRTYQENLMPEQLSQMHAFCRQVESAFPNVRYLDLETDERFLEDDFYDADHLNELGARKLTQVLDNYIISPGISGH